MDKRPFFLNGLVGFQKRFHSEFAPPKWKKPVLKPSKVVLDRAGEP